LIPEAAMVKSVSGTRWKRPEMFSQREVCNPCGTQKWEEN